MKRYPSEWCVALLVLVAALSGSSADGAGSSKKGHAKSKPSMLVPEARAPKGLRLRWFSYTGKQLAPGIEERQLWAWGATKEELFQRLGEQKPLCLPSGREGVLDCTFGSVVAGTWYADFGEAFFQVLNAEFFKGAFCSYVVEFPEDKYDFVKEALTEALGSSGLVTNATVSNSYGASFAQEEVIWASSKVAISLERRSGTIDKGHLAVIYLPIAEKAPKLPTGKVPF